MRSRFYFTSASHLHTLVNAIRIGLDVRFGRDTDEIKELMHLDYLSSVAIRLLENLHSEVHDNERFKIEIFISGGVQY